MNRKAHPEVNPEANTYIFTYSISFEVNNFRESASLKALMNTNPTRLTQSNIIQS